MFSIIIAIVAIALIVALVLAAHFFGGSSITAANDAARAARLKNEEQQILGAAEMFQAQHKRWPLSMQELVDTGMLNSVPRHAQMPALISQALAADGVSEAWTMPIAGSPLFVLESVNVGVCRQYNQLSRGDDGILSSAYTELTAQCYGRTGFRVVVGKLSAMNQLSEAVGSADTVVGGLPPTSNTAVWTVLPGGAYVPPEPTYEPLLRVMPASLAFGAVDVESTSAAKRLTLTNDGSATAAGLAFSVPAPYLVTANTCSTSLAAGSSCYIEVALSPVTAGDAAASATIAADTLSALVVNLTGQGQILEPVLSLLPGSINFGMVQVGSTSSAQELTVANQGGAAKGLSYNLPSGYQLVSTTCTTTLAAKASCAIQLAFQPAGPGANTANFSLNASNAASLMAELNGFGKVLTQAGLSSLPASVSTPTGAFGNVYLSQTKDVTTYVLPISGNVDGLTVGANLSGSSEFTIVSAVKVNAAAAAETCGAQVSSTAVSGCAGDTLQNATADAKTALAVSVRFAPVSGGAKTAQLQLSHNGTNASPLTLALNGTGALPLSLAADSGSSSTFPSTPLGRSNTQTFRATNTSPVPVTGLSVQLNNAGSDFVIDENNCASSTLAQGESCTVKVTFTPHTMGTVSPSPELLLKQGSVTVSSVLPLSASGSGGNVYLAPNATARTWSNGDIAASCKDYLTPSSSYTYTGDTGDGLYRIQPAGQPATNVYCDMTADGGGWTLVVKAVRKTTTSTEWSTATGDFNTSVLADPAWNSASGKFSDAFINAVKGSTSAVYRLQGYSTRWTVPTRYAKGTCVYDQTPVTPANFAGRTGCNMTYSNAGTTVGGTTFSATNTGGTIGGISDARFSGPNVTYVTVRGGGTDSWVLGSNGACQYENNEGAYKNASCSAGVVTGGQGTDFRLWVR